MLRGRFLTVASNVASKVRALSALSVVFLCLVAGSAASSSQHTLLVSVSWDGKRADGVSTGGSLSGNGRYVSFGSSARNIVRTGRGGIVVRDMRRRRTTRIADGGGSQITPNGRFVLFCTPRALVRQDYFEPSDLGEYYNDAYVYDRATRRFLRASMPVRGARRSTNILPACGYTPETISEPEISVNGRFVVFGSRADYIVRGDTNREHDVFVRDLVRGRTMRVSVTNAGKQANGRSVHPHIVRNRYVYFCSGARNLGVPSNGAGLFVRDLVRHTTTQVAMPAASGGCPLDFAAHAHLFVYATPPLGPDGQPRQSHLVVRNARTGASDVITTGIGRSPPGEVYTVGGVVLSPDGRYVAFASNSPNFTPHDTNGLRDVFWLDRLRRRIVRVSVRADGSEIDRSDSGSAVDSISADGRWVAWETNDDRVVLDEPPGSTLDVFVTGPLH